MNDPQSLPKRNTTTQIPIISDAAREAVDAELRPNPRDYKKGHHVQSLLDSTTAPLLAEIERLKNKNKQTAKDFETAFRLVREENDTLRTRAETAERERDEMRSMCQRLIAALHPAQKRGDETCPLLTTDSCNTAPYGPIPAETAHSASSGPTATPETDAATIESCGAIWDLAGVGPIVNRDFARTLERERNAERALRSAHENAIIEFGESISRISAERDTARVNADHYKRAFLADWIENQALLEKAGIDFTPDQTGGKTVSQGIEELIASRDTERTARQAAEEEIRNLASLSAVVITERDEARADRDIFKREFLRNVEAASVFQCGGNLHDEANLRLGSSIVVEGIAWLLRNREAMLADIEAAAALEHWSEDNQPFDGAEKIRARFAKWRKPPNLPPAAKV